MYLICPPTLRMTALKILWSDNLTIVFLITDRTESLSSVFPLIRLLYAQLTYGPLWKTNPPKPDIMYRI